MYSAPRISFYSHFSHKSRCLFRKVLIDRDLRHVENRREKCASLVFLVDSRGDIAVDVVKEGNRRVSLSEYTSLAGSGSGGASAAAAAVVIRETTCR